MNIANGKYVKKLNRLKILNLIKNNPDATRRELANITGLTPPAITGIIRELIDLDFVREVGLGSSFGGRRPVKLEFNNKRGFVIGIEITRYEVSIGIADLKHPPKTIERISVDMTSPEEGIQFLINKIKNLQSRNDKPILGVGIAFPGLIKAWSGIVARSVNLGPLWRGVAVKEELANGLDIPIYIENNSNVSALAEKYFGLGQMCRNLVYINAGEGISAGLLLDDKIFQGHAGYSGEIGHIVVSEDGPLCNCGNRGCLEAICGVPALVRKAVSEIQFINHKDPVYLIWQQKNTLNFEDLVQTCNVKDSYSYQMFQQFGKYLGLAVANLINIYNPDTVCIGGKIAQAYQAFFDIFIQTVKSHAFPDIAGLTEFKISRLGYDSGVCGACALVVRELLTSNESQILDQDSNHT